MYRPIVIVPLGIEAGVFGIVAGAQLASRQVRFNGANFARDFPLGLALSWNAGVTEEAFERGFVYEELKLAMPKWPARFVDMAIFTALHVPGEIREGDGAGLIIFGLVTRAAGGLLMDAAYDEGGLALSIPLHAAWDGIVFTAGAVTGQKLLGNAFGALLKPGNGQAATPILFPLVGGAF